MAGEQTPQASLTFCSHPRKWYAKLLPNKQKLNYRPSTSMRLKHYVNFKPHLKQGTDGTLTGFINCDSGYKVVGQKCYKMMEQV